MSDEEKQKSQDLVFGITMPRRVSVVALGTAVITLAGAIAFATTLDGRVRALEEGAESDREALMRIERTLCVMCVQQIGADSCARICRTGGPDGEH